MVTAASASTSVRKIYASNDLGLSRGLKLAVKALSAESDENFPLYCWLLEICTKSRCDKLLCWRWHSAAIDDYEPNRFFAKSTDHDYEDGNVN